MMRAMSRLAAVVILAAASLDAQRIVSARAGMVSYIQGDVFLDREPEQLGSSKLLQLRDGQGVRTEQGRAELLVGPDAVLWVDQHSQARFEKTDLDDVGIRLEAGSVLIEV